VAVRVDLNLAALLVYGTLLAVLSWKVAAPLWPYLVLGLLIAVLSFPIHRRLRAETERPRISAATTVTVALLVAIVPLAALSWRIVQDIRGFTEGLTVEAVTGTGRDAMVGSNEAFGYPQDVQPGAARELLADQIPAVREAVTGWLPHALASFGEFLIGVLLAVIVAFYALLHGQRFLSRFKDASPMEDDVEEYFFAQTKLTINGVVWGQLVTAALQGFLGWLAFFVAGIPNAVLWGFVMAILSFLPMVGAFLVWIPGAVYLFVQGQPVFAIGLVLWGAIVVGVSDDLVRPMVIGRSAALHPVLAFVGVLGGLLAFGIMGFVLGPLVLALFAVVFDILADSEWRLDEWEPPAVGEDEGDEEQAEGA
jgi:predicted PurR-regulated permease PerM